MNRILFYTEEMRDDGTVTLSGARAEHVIKVLRAEAGSTLKTGTVDGLAGMSIVETVADGRVTLRPEHDTATSDTWVDLILAVPRPKTLKRLWPQLAALGVGRIVLVNGRRVEKCYFDSHWLGPLFYRPLLLEGLMQAGLSKMPEVLERRRFKPFIEDELDSLFPSTCRLVAHPGARTTAFENCVYRRPLLAVGPEGGWSGYELDMLRAHGFCDFSLGDRVLRTDTACIALIAVLENLFS